MYNTTLVQKYGHPLTTNRSAEKWQVIFNLSLSVEHVDSENRLVNLNKISGTRKYPKPRDIIVSDASHHWMCTLQNFNVQQRMFMLYNNASVSQMKTFP